MANLLIKENTKISFDSDSSNTASLSVVVTDNSSLIIDVKGHEKMDLTIDCKVNENVQFSCLLLNNNENEITINDNYTVERDAKATIAYSQLNNQKVLTNSNYDLVSEGADVRVLSVSITSTQKSFNQNTNHLAGHTTAHIDNYGVVLANGRCELVVKNTIARGYHNCDTHQTSRLLTYDKTAQGKILPILCIDDNEVTASHACSLGQPDENQIYYLQTRGLSYDEALGLITIGYLLPITKIIDDESINTILKEEIEQKVKSSCLK